MKMLPRPRSWQATLCLPLVLGACANACQDGPVATRAAQKSDGPPEASGDSDLKPSNVRKASPKEPTLTWQALAPFAPEQLDGYAADGEAVGNTLTLKNGATIPTLKRKYTKGEVSVDIEMLDALHSPMVLGIVNSLQGADKSHDGTILRGVEVDGHKAVVQWQPDNRAGRVGVVLKDRYVVNVKVTPSSSPEPAVALVKQLDLKGIEALAPIEPAAPAETTEGEAAEGEAIE